MKYWCLLDWGGTDIRALRRASHGSDIDYNIQLRSMAFDKNKIYIGLRPQRWSIFQGNGMVNVFF